MVYILDGQVLQDDDPRVQQRKRGGEQPRQTSHPHYRSNVSAVAGRHTNRVRPEVAQGLVGHINQQLTSYGVPKFSIANRVVEPIALVGGLILLMVFGVRGLLLGGVVWFMTQPSRNT